MALLNLMRRGIVDNATFQNANLFGAIFSDFPEAIFWIQNCTIPGRYTGVANLRWMNGVFTFVKAPRVDGQWQASFILDENMTIYKYLQAWYERIFNVNTGVLGTNATAKRNIQVFLLDTTARLKTLQITMWNCIMESIVPIGEGGALQMGAAVTGPGMGTGLGDAPIVQAVFDYEYHTVDFEEPGILDGV